MHAGWKKDSLAQADTNSHRPASQTLRGSSRLFQIQNTSLTTIRQAKGKHSSAPTTTTTIMEDLRSSTPCVPAAAAPASLPAPSYSTALLAGGFAGMTVDIALYPIDTIKTRLQAPVGFWKAGGFHGVYRGLGATATGSGPGAALFFCTYEALKPIVSEQLLQKYGYDPNEYAYLSHMVAASSAEAVACLVRVPTEVVKSKMQTASSGARLLPTLQAAWQERTGSPIAFFTGGLYRGYGITLFREIPFAMIQFPLYEKMKQSWAASQNVETVNPLQAATCGSVAGGIAGAITTPLDVLKTRLMLGSDQLGVPYRGVTDVFQRTWTQDGPMALWRGFQPRVFWISLGGFVFLGAYEAGKVCILPVLG